MEEMTFKELRKKKNLTQEQLAERSGYSKDYISMIERGKRRPSDKAKEVFSRILNVPIVQIFLALQRTKSATKKIEETT